MPQQMLPFRHCWKSAPALVMQRLHRWAVCLVSGLCLVGSIMGSAQSAEISISANGGPSLITVKGELALADVVQFLRKTDGLKDAVVVLKSPGGNAVAGIQIGRAIRKRGFLTAVAPSTNCASACALAWLGGTPRFMAEGSQIGFHAAYFVKGGRPRKSKTATAVIAAYLRQLGLSKRATAYITGSPPERMYWLTIEGARDLGLEAGVYTQEGISSTLDAAQAGPVSAFKRVGFVDLIGVDFPGMPMRNIGAVECEARCKGNGECAGFTFNVKRSACFLKSSAELAVGHPAAVSGYRGRGEPRIRRIDMTVQEATDYPGNDIGRLKRTTFKACLLACSGNASCKAFTFIARRGDCWLKNAIGSGEPRSGLVSAIK